LLNVKKRPFYGWYIVLASWAIIFIPTAVAIGVFFKPILAEFQWDRAVLSAVQSVALFAFTFAAPFLGRLVDRIGPRKMIAISITCQAVSTIINGFATAIWHMYVARFIFALDSRHFTKILVSRWFIRLRGTALGLASTAVPLGTLILTPLSQYMVLLWTWRPTMFFWAAVMLAVLLPLIFIIRDNPRDKGLSPDGDVQPEPETGQFILNGDLESQMYAEQTGFNTTDAVRTGAFWLLSTTQFICGIGCGFIMTHTIIFATDMGFSDMVGATVMSVNGGFSLLGVLVMGYASDRIRRKNALGITFIFRSVSFGLMMLFVTVSSTVAAFPGNCLFWVRLVHHCPTYRRGYS
jgi:MFS family permease